MASRAGKARSGAARVADVARKPGALQEAPAGAKAEAARDAFLHAAGEPGGLASALARADGATRAHAVSRLQRQYGNAFVQRTLGGAARAAADDDLARRIEAARGSGSGIDPPPRQRLELGLGGDLSGVRVHADGEADSLATSVQAVAFTSGQDIYFRHGAYSPGSSDGLRLLAHESAHVIQQGAGPVAGTPAPGGVTISDPDDQFERAADSAAGSVVGGAVSAAAPLPYAQAARGGEPVQRAPFAPVRTAARATVIQRQRAIDDPLSGEVSAGIGNLERALRSGFSVTAAPMLLQQYLQLRPTYLQQHGEYKAAVAGVEATPVPVTTDADLANIQKSTANNKEVVQIKSEVMEKSATLTEATSTVRADVQNVAHQQQILIGLQQNLDGNILSKLVHDSQPKLDSLVAHRARVLALLQTLVQSPASAALGEMAKLFEASGEKLENPASQETKGREDLANIVVAQAANALGLLTNLLPETFVAATTAEIQALQQEMRADQANADSLKVTGTTNQIEGETGKYRTLVSITLPNDLQKLHRAGVAAQQDLKRLADAVNAALKKHNAGQTNVFAEVGTVDQVVARFDVALVKFQPTLKQYAQQIDQVLAALDPPPRREEVSYSAQDLANVVRHLTLEKLDARDDSGTFDADEKMAGTLQSRAASAQDAAMSALPGK